MDVSIAATGNAVAVGTPTLLFEVHPTPNAQLFEAAPDGRRFLIARPVPAEQRLQIILNWPARTNP